MTINLNEILAAVGEKILIQNIPTKFRYWLNIFAISDVTVTS